VWAQYVPQAEINEDSQCSMRKTLWWCKDWQVKKW